MDENPYAPPLKDPAAPKRDFLPLSYFRRWLSLRVIAIGVAVFIVAVVVDEGLTEHALLGIGLVILGFISRIRIVAEVLTPSIRQPAALPRPLREQVEIVYEQIGRYLNESVESLS